MTARPPPFGVYPGGRAPREGALPSRSVQELWFAIARRPWVSVVLVPAEPGASAADVATSLADVGTRLRDTPVTAIVADAIDYDSARLLSDLNHITTDGGGRRGARVVEVEATAVPGDPAPLLLEPPMRDAALLPPLGRVIVAIRPVVDEPLGVAVAQAADAVVLCVEMGSTRLASARRTIELIGADRVMGAFLLRT